MFKVEPNQFCDSVYIGVLEMGYVVLDKKAS